MFFDLADPEKRTREDILRALDLIGQFEQYFNVILGLNEKEAHEVGDVFGIRAEGDDAGGAGRTGAGDRRAAQGRAHW